MTPSGAEAMRIRPLVPEDATAFGEFVAGIPEGDRTFFKDDLLDPAVVDFLLAGRRGIRLAALTPEGRIAAYGALLRAWAGPATSATSASSCSPSCAGAGSGGGSHGGWWSRRSGWGWASSSSRSSPSSSRRC